VPEPSDIAALVEGGLRPVSGEEARRLAASSSAPKRAIRHRARVVIPIGALVTAAIVLALVLLPAGVGDGPQPAAASELQLLASRAANVNVASLAPGQYLYTEIETQTTEVATQFTPNGSAVHEYLSGTQQTWLDDQGYGRMVITTDPTPHFASKADEDVWKAAGSPPALVPPNQLKQVVTVTPTWAGGLAATPLFQVTGLPTDPNALEDVLASGRFKPQLTSGPQCQSRDCTVVAAAAALLEGPDIGATPALRSALFEVLSHVAGVTDLGTVTDMTGQTGIGLSFTQNIPARTLTVHCSSGTTDANMTLGPGISFHLPASTVTYEFVVDPQSTSLIGTNDVANPDMQPAPPNACPGSPLPQSPQQKVYVSPHWSSVLSEGIVGSETSTSLTTGS
jgi:hypothetical protein